MAGNSQNHDSTQTRVTVFTFILNVCCLCDFKEDFFKICVHYPIAGNMELIKRSIQVSESFPVKKSDQHIILTFTGAKLIKGSVLACDRFKVKNPVQNIIFTSTLTKILENRCIYHKTKVAARRAGYSN